MANVKPIRENGIVLGKCINEAREAGESLDGSIKWAAREKQFVLKIISCDEEEFSKINGFVNETILDYVVDETTYNKAKLFDWCAVKYELRNGEKGLKGKALGCALIENTK